ncbi:helix-turn-helix domain-containing protein [Kutzneria sp. NPDC052558]|uniref:helix-turn-helix domain-containing protein n=1 Tax=Kutzneria sp. NPDC052558 TaxID=3364121 RepID=UPI0037C7F746
MGSTRATYRACDHQRHLDAVAGPCGLHHGAGRLFVPESVFSEPAVRAGLAVRNVGPLFKAVRTELRLSQLELAVTLGLSQGQVSDAENGAHRLVKVGPVLDVLIALGTAPELIGFPHPVPVALWARTGRRSACGPGDPNRQRQRQVRAPTVGPCCTARPRPPRSPPPAGRRVPPPRRPP